MRMLALLFVLTLSLTSSARADVVYSTFTGGPGAYGTEDASQTLPAPFIGAVSFVPTATGLLDTISLKLEGFFGTTAGTLSLLTDSGSKTPTPSLESFPLSHINSLPNRAVKPVASTPHPPLVQGLKYWVLLAPANGGDLGWYLNAQG